MLNVGSTVITQNSSGFVANLDYIMCSFHISNKLSSNILWFALCHSNIKFVICIAFGCLFLCMTNTATWCSLCGSWPEQDAYTSHPLILFTQFTVFFEPCLCASFLIFAMALGHVGWNGISAFELSCGVTFGVILLGSRYEAKQNLLRHNNKLYHYTIYTSKFGHSLN